MRLRWMLLCFVMGAVACGGELGEHESLEAQGSRLTVTTEDQLVTRMPASTGTLYGYVEYLPPGYLTSPETRYPVIIHLNGRGEFGTAQNEAALFEKGTANGALKKIRHEPTAKTYFGQKQVMIFTPQAATNWVPAEVNAFVDFIVANYRVDLSRIYVTGLSYGGYGAWQYAYTYGHRLAALAPMATNIGGPGPTITQLKNVPVWAVHSFADGNSLLAERSWLMGVTKNFNQGQMVTVPQPSATLTYLFAGAASNVWTSQPGYVSTGNLQARLTVIPGSAHDCWTQTYNNYAFWDWLLAQQRALVP
ncbi:alpha/beta hydrolase-fold protein [Myxococcus fulvus]|uniref:carboxylesterase family protein n=1 Tax=Myxococcus fulvus TaxID=33 RepID=UPI0020BEC820|nr:PHB depolymerase family esterase [Myxococcus fulvus]MCK8496673.1 phospholipase [Myxococcus fulvus]